MPIDPPSVRREPALAARLEAIWAGFGPDYRPRTHRLGPDGRARYVNRLIGEASPYLLQHAHNPVDWWPWGEAALAEARARDCPVFLSVGYATCHWCHVMEEESFDDEAVAAALNRDFVPVKLDREARPDLDGIYIAATQLQHGHAGWPNSVFLRPDGVPFHTGTYFPRAQFLRVLAGVARAWAGQRAEIDAVAAQLATAIRRQQEIAGAPAEAPGPETFAAAAAHLARLHNEAEGGFSGGQQFPQEVFLAHLLDRWRRDGDDRALAIAARTLDAIVAGGIHDHAGGGFHRYTVDVTWRTPHFEKMLYNQGQIARCLVEGWETTGRPAWRRAAERCFAYVLRDMTDAEGAFLAAEDADSPDAAGRREEGAFYLWTPDQAIAALGLEDGAFAVEVLGLAAPWHEVGPVAHLRPGWAGDLERLDRVLERLRQAREARPRPIRDDKVIAGWNGLMIRALADGAAAFGEPRWAGAAARAGEAIWRRLWDGTRLARLWAAGGAREAGQLEDYAWVGLGFLALFEATGEARWLDRAQALGRAAARDFADPSGRLRVAAAEGPLGPVFDSADGATPSGESSALELLARLAAATGDTTAGLGARRLLAAIAGPMRDIPILRPEGLTAARVLTEGASTLRRLLAQGTLAVQLARTAAGWELRVRIAEGWHLTAAEPGAPGLEGARVEGAEIDWPAGTLRALGFAGAPARVWEGRIAMPLRPAAAQVTLRLQACSDQLCLAPAVAVFRLPAAASGGTLGA